MEKLIIKGFAGLDFLEIDLNNINVIIGPQASGKSVTVKLFFFFKSFFGELRKGIEDKKYKKEIDKEHLNRFLTYFPKESWSDNDFYIEYIINESSMRITKQKNNAIKFDYSKNIKDIIKKARNILERELESIEKSSSISSFQLSHQFSKRYNELINKEISPKASFEQIFIPAGRSFFSNIQASIFSFLSSNKSLDPFLIQFGSFYESIKRFSDDVFDTETFNKNSAYETIDFDRLVNEILNSRYLRKKEKDYLLHNDNRTVNVSNASSGQQEILPLLVILKTLLKVSFLGEGAVLYIEEPEAHLFPNAQKKVVQLLARIFNSTKNDFQIIITTHSPYILSSLNNLLYAGYLRNNMKEKAKLYSVVPEIEIISPDRVYAYSLTKEKKIKPIIDKETQLISQNVLDDVSNEISIEFGKLLDLEE